MQTIPASTLRTGDKFTYSGHEYSVENVTYSQGIVSVTYGGEFPIEFYPDTELEVIPRVFIGQSHLGVNHLLNGYQRVCTPSKTSGRTSGSLDKVTCGKCKNTKFYKDLRNA